MTSFVLTVNVLLTIIVIVCYAILIVKNLNKTLSFDTLKPMYLLFAVGIFYMFTRNLLGGLGEYPRSLFLGIGYTLAFSALKLLLAKNIWSNLKIISWILIIDVSWTVIYTIWSVIFRA